LLRLLNGLETPTSGTVLVDGKEISRLSERELRFARQKIGMIFQHFHLLWSRTVAENVAFPLEIAGVPKKQIKEKVSRLLELVGLSERADAYPAQLSGGQKQRVGIARALANDPDVLLCDEATSALDPETTASILRLLKQIHQKLGLTLVLITHEMSVVRAICNKMAVMENGRIIETGPVSEIFQNPKHPLTKKFVQDVEPGQDGVWVPWSGLSKLDELARQYNVHFQLVGGEVKGSNDEDAVQVKIGGNDEAVEKVRKVLGGELECGSR
jgi:D-methionine transport system ATP-binding protein